MEVKVRRIFNGLYEVSNGWSISRVYGVWRAIPPQGSMKESIRFSTFKEVKKFVVSQ